MKTKIRWPFGRKWLFLPPAILGVAVLGLMTRNRSEPQQVAVVEVARKLRVIDVTEVALVPRVVGYGTAQPGDVWTAVAEVKGRVVATHPELNPGAILRADEEVLRIDPTEYELQIAQFQAEIAEIQSQQAQLAAQEENFLASIEIERDSLKLAESDLERLRSLVLTDSVTRAEVEGKEREVLAQRQSVQSRTNSLNVLPAQRQSLVALLDAKKAGLGRAELDLSHAVITAPFDCRLGELSIEKGQFLAAGQVLFEAHGTAVTEIEARYPIDLMHTLLTSTEVPINPIEGAMKTMREVFDVDATVRMRTGDFVVQWEGRFDRVREQLDLQTRTVRIVIAVDNPYENVIPGKRPPLTPGMFCEVELRGKPRTGQIVIPRTTIRDGHVYLVDAENRLERRKIEVAFSQGGFSCLTSGLAPGERLIISDPTPAIEGMLVEPVADAAALQSLLSEATGEGPIR